MLKVSSDYSWCCKNLFGVSFIYSLQLCVYVCLAGHQPVECVQIMGWWSSNLRQGSLCCLVSVGNCYVLFYLTHPSLSSCFLISFHGRQPPPALTPPPPTCLCTGSSALLGFTCICPSIPMPTARTLILAVCVPPLQPSLAPVTLYGFVLPPHPCH